MNDFQPSAQSCKEAEVVSDQAPSDEAVSERDELTADANSTFPWGFWSSRWKRV